MEIGIKIKQMRLSLGLTQEELADRCEITKGYISQLENDLTSPSIATLSDILAALGSDLSEFFENAGKDERVVFSEDAFIVKETDEAKLTWLVPNSQKNTMEPILMIIKKGSQKQDDMPHEGEEFGYVLKGRIKITLGSKSYIVKKGESFYYECDKIHSMECVGSEDAKIIWVSSPPNF